MQHIILKSPPIQPNLALYGLKTSGTRFHEKFVEIMYQLRFMPSKADSNIWMKDYKDHQEYVCTC
eukprot:8473676-Ditylum_brightwellii.AAC.1